MKKQKVVIIQLCVENGSREGFKKVSCLEEVSAQSENKQWQKISLQELLDVGWEIKNGWPMGGGNISTGQCDATTKIGPFVSMILLEKEVP
ncbi:MAG: hypothetical protein PHE24_04385 [Patescibacteria group bacterium]|nr:hypothetical protein [Patescibacteria group bacterium]